MSRFAFAAAALIALAAATPALAQGAGGQVRTACANDAKTLCAGVKPGGGRILQCFKEHQDQVSKECQSALEAAQAARAGNAGTAQ